MHILRSPEKVRETVGSWHAAGLTVGLVPTMGALHEGHLSLVRAAAGECDRTICSIFVNPTQFGEGEDFDTYPRRLREDARKLEGVGANLAFAPTEKEMYPSGYCTYVVQEELTERLCGARRPGHFRGVCTVVTKLLNICAPDRAFFGRKDFQQSVVLRRMARDLNIPVQIRVMPTVREPDGLAVSSRNEYLAAPERSQAVCLYEALHTARRMFRAGESAPDPIIETMRGLIEENPDAEIDYIQIVSPEDLRPVRQVSEDSVAALAVYIGQTRLIDNMPFGEAADIFKEPES